MNKTKTSVRRIIQSKLVNKNDTYLDNEMARPTIYPDVLNKHKS